MTTITVTYDTAGSGTWLCPAGVTSIAVACWGGGGGGGGYDSATTTSGGGGGGGAYAYESAVTVTPGNRYAWSVGTGGQGGTPVRGGYPGGSSSLAGDTLTVTANGGQEGYNGSAGGNGGAGAASGGNSTAYAGGTGAAGVTEAGGGGGSSAGTAAAGTTATDYQGATAPSGGGKGGNGGLAIVPVGLPQPGAAPGGGGGGGSPNDTTGAVGAAGTITITYTATFQPAIPFFPAGYAPTPADFNAWVQAPLVFLTNKIVFRAALTTATTLPSGTALVIPYNDILEDPYSGWNATAHQWVCPGGYTGLYEVTVTASCLSTGGAPSLQARAAINSQAYEYAVDTTFVPAAASGVASGAVPVQLYGGTDSVQGIAFMLGTQGTTDSVAGRQCELVVTWLAS